MSRQRIIAGNWKMNGTNQEAQTLIEALKAELSAIQFTCDVVVCPPFTAIPGVGWMLKGSQIKLGAQDVSRHKSGAYTGEVSAAMLLTLGVSHVIIGHSERRQYHAEGEDLINSKVVAALEAGLIPIVCVGETLTEREMNTTKPIIERQVVGAIGSLSAEQLSRIVIAYEPVWEIGTVKTATPDMAQDVHAFIRELLSGINKTSGPNTPILYGGSVKADNAAGLLSQTDIDGALVGGASLNAKDFAAIVKAA
jgi:triosephosphate isomerase